MKLKKQLTLLQTLLDSNLREERKQRKELHHLLKRMKHKEKTLKEERDDEANEERRARLDQEIEILHAQRKKGIAALKAADPENAKPRQD